jgi:hypothetical protein
MSTERDIIIERLEQKLAARDKEYSQMQESLRESILMEMEKRFSDTIRECENRMDRLERRLIELNSSYDGVMRELLDQKSIIRELKPKKPEKEEPKLKPKEKAEHVEKTKGEYIIADNYIPREKKTQKDVIEAEQKTIVAGEKPAEKEQIKKAAVKKSERTVEGVEIIETLKTR